VKCLCWRESKFDVYEHHRKNSCCLYVQLQLRFSGTCVIEYLGIQAQVYTVPLALKLSNDSKDLGSSFKTEYEASPHIIPSMGHGLKSRYR